MTTIMFFIVSGIAYLFMTAVSAAVFWRLWRLQSPADNGLQWLAGIAWPLVWVGYGPVKLMNILYRFILNYERRHKLPQARVVK